jgi:hypothetical protein
MHGDAGEVGHILVVDDDAMVRRPRSGLTASSLSPHYNRNVLSER